MFNEEYCPATLSEDCNIIFNEEYCSATLAEGGCIMFNEGYILATLAGMVVLCLIRNTAL